MTTYNQKFRNLMQTAVEAAREKFMRDGSLPMVTWLIEDKYDIRILIGFAPDVTKDNMLEQMRKIAKDKEIVRYSVEVEAWSAVATDDMRRPKDRPDRMESIVVYGQDRQGNSSCTMIEIERKGDKAFLGEAIETASASGAFQLFEEGEIQ